MDWGSLIGLVLGVSGILVGQILEGGHVRSLIQPAAFVIVMVGTLGAVLLQSGLSNFMRGLKKARMAFTPSDNNDASLARDMALWSTTARREGFLSLERYLTTATDPFIQQGLRLIIDGVDPSIMRELLNQEISAYEARERLAVKVWESAGGYSPTIGILGAVLGLIHVMENLSDPSRLGAGIAVAFVATIYGVGMANLFFLPIGARLRAQLGMEVQRREMLADAFVGVATSENSRVIEERMLIYRKK
ncbi:MAG: flagellar motor protein [Burkholderiaceae bacterium]|nr:flagellar motor protein [Burkholderiaceae bacterium]